MIQGSKEREINLISNDYVDKLKLNNNEFVKENNWGKKKEQVFRRGTWLTHYVKVIYINTVF